ncbi:GDP/GTP exchange factor for ARF [Serendipita sp. 399]|nr:GDP/GTP exchange factor for ARF [Serendipita sp. 399]
MSTNAEYNLAVPSTHLVYSEILSVTSTMRKNSRWATPIAYYPTSARASLASSLGLRAAANTVDGGDASKAKQPVRTEVDLMVGFEQLKRDVRASTAAALSSLRSFFCCGLISPSSPDLRPALSELSNTISHCKFDAGGNNADEGVILRIMAVVKECICGPTGSVLGDIEVCEMLETVLTTCCQVRLGEAVRRAAEYHMHDLVRIMFRRLDELQPVEEEDMQEEENTELRMNVSPTREDITPGIEQMLEPPSSDRAKTPVPVTANVNVTPYGLPSITELLKVLLSLLDPTSQQHLSRSHTDSLLIPSLSTLNVAFATAGPTVAKFAPLRQLVMDNGCKFLFQLARSDNPTVLSLALRTIATVFETMRPHLKLQQELLLSFLVDKLTPPPGSLQGAGKLGIPQRKLVGASSNASASDLAEREQEEESEADGKPPSRAGRAGITPARGETRELMLEILGHLSRYPDFMVDVWVNYDCDVNCEDVFERLIDFLSKSVQYADQQQRGAQVLCLDLLLSFVNHMANRVEQEHEAWPKEYPPIQTILEAKSKKLLLLTGASRFNKHPKGGIAFLEEHKLVNANAPPNATEEEIAAYRAQDIARFLKTTPRLDKKLVGEFIAKPDNGEILKAFIGLFDFHGVPIAEAMREMLESFRLPGEAQQIERITDTFAAKYFASKPDEIKSQDAVHVLSYAIIMLNTDLYNPQVRKRMTFDDFKRNLRGVNDNTDFSIEFLQAIYDSIKKREIVMPEEHVGQLGFDYAWKELLIRSKQTRPLMSCHTADFDSHMFKLVWRPVVGAITTAFSAPEDDYIVEKIITGFRDCATLATHFKQFEVLDFIVMSLAHSTGLADELNFPRQSNFPIVEVEGQSITVSALSVRFGTSLRSQLATVVLFAILNGNVNNLRESWGPIIDILQNLFLYSLLPARMIQMEDFLGGVSAIPLSVAKPTQQAARLDGGLLSALSSYLLTPYGSSTDTLIEATPEETEKTMCAVDCIAACHLENLNEQILGLDPEALYAALRTIQDAANKRTVHKLKLKQNEELPVPSNVPTRERTIQPLPYDAASVFLLEMMIGIASHRRQYIQDVCLHDQLFVALDTLGGLPGDIQNAISEQLIAGLSLLLRNHRSAIRSPTEWKITYGLLRATIAHPLANKQTLEVLTNLINDEELPVDGVEGLVMVLDDIATLAGSVTEKKRPPHNTARDPLIERACAAVELLFECRKFVPRIAASPNGQAQGWGKYALPILISLSHQSVNPCREVRHAAIVLFQRILMGPQILHGGGPEQIVVAFHQAVFPLVQDLLDPGVYAHDPLPGGMSETRLRASGLLCRGFLYYLDPLSSEPETLTTLWLEVVELLEQLMMVDQRSQLYEAVPESLKNVLLVMQASGALLSPANPEDRPEEIQRRWQLTLEKVDTFIPGFLTEVIPLRLENPEEPATAAVVDPVNANA